MSNVDILAYIKTNNPAIFRDPVKVRALIKIFDEERRRDAIRNGDADYQFTAKIRNEAGFREHRGYYTDIFTNYSKYLFKIADGKNTVGMTLSSVASYTNTLAKELHRQQAFKCLLLTSSNAATFERGIPEPPMNSAENRRCHSRLHHSFKNFNKFIIHFNHVQYTSCIKRSWVNILFFRRSNRSEIYNDHVQMIK